MLITEDKEIDLFVASKIGSFKHIKYHTDTTKNNKKCIENLVDVKSLQKDDNITCMAWSNAEQTEIILGHKSKQVQIYNTQEHIFTKTYTADFTDGELVGVGRCHRKLLVAASTGVVKVWGKKREHELNTGGKLDRMRTCPDEQTMFATGGEENDLKVWQVGIEAPIFAAKNLPDDWLQLRRPVWVSDLSFMPMQGGNVLAVCSRHGYVRLYDIRAQRRPVCCVDFTNMAATSIAPSFDERQVFIGFGRGQLHQVDLRTKGRPDKGYKGAAGAITSIDLVKQGRLVVSASLDRMLRIHQHDTKEMVYKQYLTSKLSFVLVQNENRTQLKCSPELDVKEEIEGDEMEIKEEVDEMDQLFDNMPTITEETKSKKKEPASKKVQPSSEGATTDLRESDNDERKKDEAIMQLLKNTKQQKRKMERRMREKKEKRAKTLFYKA